jgi:hypothetical protein
MGADGKGVHRAGEWIFGGERGGEREWKIKEEKIKKIKKMEKR